MGKRSNLEKLIWRKIGPPLYYCEECMRAVNVKRNHIGYFNDVADAASAYKQAAADMHGDFFRGA